MSYILITRPYVDAQPLAQTLKSKGLKPLLCPLYEPHFLSLPPLKDPQALIITSKNALRALEKAEDLKKLPLYGVGDETALLAERMGFTTVMSSSGTSEDLLKLILKHAQPKMGILYHLSGQIIKVDLIKELQAKGLKGERHIAYSIQDVDTIPGPLLYHIQNQKISHVLFFSSRTANIFVNLFNKNKLGERASSMIALCLSQDVAQAIRSLEWKAVWISPEPTMKTMIEYFDG